MKKKIENTSQNLSRLIKEHHFRLVNQQHCILLHRDTINTFTQNINHSVTHVATCIYSSINFNYTSFKTQILNHKTNFTQNTDHSLILMSRLIH